MLLETSERFPLFTHPHRSDELLHFHSRFYFRRLRIEIPMCKHPHLQHAKRTHKGLLS